MADNVTANPGVGGAVFRTDDDGTAQWPYAKLAWGADNTQTIVAAGASAIPVQDGGNSLTVDGTVTANLAAGTNNIGDVDVLTVPADPFGANADAASASGSISAKLRRIAETGIPVSGTVTANLAAGTNNIGDVDVLTVPADPFGANADAASASGSISAKLRRIAETGIPVSGTVTANLAAGTNNIGDVDVLTIIPATGATNLGKAIDAVGGATDTGVAVLAIRDDALTTLTPADGDYVPLRTDSEGAIWVAAKAGAAQKLDDAAFTLTTDSVVMVGAIRDDSLSTLSAVEGDAVPLRVNSTGALHVTGAGGGTQFAEDAAHTTGDLGTLALAVRHDTSTTGLGADGDYAALVLNSAGRLFATATIDAALPAGTNNIGDVDVLTVPADPFGANADAASASGSISAKLRRIAETGIPVSGTVTANLAAGTNNIGDVDVLTVPVDPFGANADAASASGSISAKLRRIAETGIPVTGTVTVGSHAVTNAGTFATQVDGAALTALQLIDNPVLVDDAAFTPGTSSVSMAGFQADESSTDSVDEGDAGAARMTLTRKVIVNPQPHTAGGCLILKVLDNDETEDEIKATAGTLYSLYCFNATNAPLYTKLYNATASNVTVGTTVPVMTIPVPGNNDTDGAGVVLSWPMGVAFDTAITVATTTGLADNDTGAPAANAMTLAGTYF